MNKWFFVVLLVAVSSANAGGVHKCKRPDGKIVYTDSGCPQGQDLNAKDQQDAGDGSHADAGNPQGSGRQDFYREQVKSAEQSSKSENGPTPPQH